MDFLQQQKSMFSRQERDKISDLTVLIAGVGGLGTHQALELQRVGVKKIYLIDSDKIETSNLNRQVLYGRDDRGEYKVHKAKEALDKFNLGTEIEVRVERITDKTEIPSEVDLIFDALDNFTSRYHLEELAAEVGVPLIHGGVSSWYGQITAIVKGETPSLKEITGAKESKEEEIPAFSPAVSIIASLQVIEGVKVILDWEHNLKNRLLMIDLSDYTIDKIEL
ncbi:MAG: HesA/MoeB/ThiF family protein [Halanaerobacter sp.]